MFYEAFLELSTCREYGMGIGPIPWTAVAQYADRYGMTDDGSYEELRGFIRAMDTAFMGHERQRQREAASKEPAK